VDVDLIGWIGVGLGGTYGCRCGILYAHKLGVIFSLNNSTQNDDEISISPRNLGILYKTLLAENSQNLKMAAIGRNM